ncbi:MAG: hypothetical protein K0U98_07810 [Deltaproteobacteria bacterium]|nr:hypothetical protein [Deltaproteobacteria bacterium]
MAEAVLGTIQEHPITFSNFVPTTIHRLLEDPTAEGADFSSLEDLLFGGSPMQEENLRLASSRISWLGVLKAFLLTTPLGVWSPLSGTTTSSSLLGCPSS